MMQLSARSNLKFIVNNCSNIAYRVKFYRTHLFSELNEIFQLQPLDVADSCFYRSIESTYISNSGRSWGIKSV